MPVTKVKLILLIRHIFLCHNQTRGEKEDILSNIIIEREQ